MRERVARGEEAEWEVTEKSGNGGERESVIVTRTKEIGPQMNTDKHR